jgi:hypothetical protein
VILRQFLVRQKFRLDLGQWITQIIQLAMIAIAAGKTLSEYIHLPVKVIVLISVPAALFCQWLGGYILDKLKAQELYTREMNERNEMLKEIRNK